ncbi:MAG: replication initiation protein RepC, partial [Pseudomonadota bacterium]
CPARDAAHVALAKTPKAIKSEREIAVLEQICTDLKPHIEALEAVDRSRPGEAEAAEITHAGGPDDPRHIYTTTNSSSVNCNPDPGSEPPASDEADDGLCLTSASADELLRNQHRGLSRTVNSQTDGEAPPSPPAPVAWRIDQIYAAAGPEFRALLDQARDGTGQIRPRALPNTAETIARWLGINRSAWLDACHVLGPHRAALALLVIDRNRTHPKRPVHNPGGALRAMTDRARTGDLRLDASIFAILNRTKDEVLN